MLTEGQDDSIIKTITNLWLSLVLVLKIGNDARDLEKNPSFLVVEHKNVTATTSLVLLSRMLLAKSKA
ncbi:hypothetical protein DPV78_005109 [Talaromyces pinophilus]|jgi:hypothetical protein|nr:hypothetical protein DPV78_005109 [Talaromyces pinophilus]